VVNFGQMLPQLVKKKSAIIILPFIMGLIIIFLQKGIQGAWKDRAEEVRFSRIDWFDDIQLKSEYNKDDDIIVGFHSIVKYIIRVLFYHL
jgi:hypothetical protein